MGRNAQLLLVICGWTCSSAFQKTQHKNIALVYFILHHLACNNSQCIATYPVSYFPFLLILNTSSSECINNASITKIQTISSLNLNQQLLRFAVHAIKQHYTLDQKSATFGIPLSDGMQDPLGSCSFNQPSMGTMVFCPIH